MIRSFGNRGTQDIFHDANSKEARKTLPTDLRRIAQRKLDMINAAKSADDLRSPPSNHLEKLMGDLRGEHSVRINKKYRVVFRCDGGAHDVRIVDYHR